MRYRPKRENYSRGVYGDIDYQERLERYCTYLENKNKALTQVVERREQLLEGQSNWLMANTSLDVEKILDFKEHFK